MWNSGAYGARMLHEFLVTNRAALIDRCRAKVAQRPVPKVSSATLEHGVPVLIDQLVEALRIDQTSGPEPRRELSDPQKPNRTEIGATAMLHGRELLKTGFNVDQVVHGYGDLCQAVTELAFEVGAPITVAEFRILNHCLDDAIAGAVTEFTYQHHSEMTGKGVQAADERLRALANEQRTHIRTATLAMTAIKAGNVGLNGATGAILELSLVSLQKLMDRFLVGVRTATALPARQETIRVADLIAEIEVPTSLEARALDRKFTVSKIDQELAVVADRDMLFTAMGTLLQNAFNHSEQQTEVSLNAYAAGDRVMIDIADHHRGLPPGASKKALPSSTQVLEDEHGLGLGLSICRRNVEANNGVLRLRDVPGSGSVFTIELPRHSPL